MNEESKRYIGRWDIQYSVSGSYLMKTKTFGPPKTLRQRFGQRSLQSARRIVLIKFLAPYVLRVLPTPTIYIYKQIYDIQFRVSLRLLLFRVLCTVPCPPHYYIYTTSNFSRSLIVSSPNRIDVFPSSALPSHSRRLSVTPDVTE